MAFSQSVIAQALLRAGNKCECKRTSHSHKGRCSSTYKLQAHHIVAVSSGGKDILSNCEILCFTCHKKTSTFGG